MPEVRMKQYKRTKKYLVIYLKGNSTAFLKLGDVKSVTVIIWMT